MKKVLIIIVSFLALVLLTSCEKEPQPEPLRTTVVFYTQRGAHELRMPPYTVRITVASDKPDCSVMASESVKKPLIPAGTYEYTLYRATWSSSGAEGVEFLRTGTLTIVKGCNIFNLDKL